MASEFVAKLQASSKRLKSVGDVVAHVAALASTYPELGDGYRTADGKHLLLRFVRDYGRDRFMYADLLRVGELCVINLRFDDQSNVLIQVMKPTERIVAWLDGMQVDDAQKWREFFDQCSDWKITAHVSLRFDRKVDVVLRV